jgi:hypothetical protein
MKLPQTGGCQCGAIRYEIAEAPQQVYTCHCTDCQRLTSSAFSMGLVVAERAFRTSGVEPRPLQRIADSGRVNTRLVCPQCGSWLYSTPRDGLVRVRAGTLDDTSWLRPGRGQPRAGREPPIGDRRPERRRQLPRYRQRRLAVERRCPQRRARRPRPDLRLRHIDRGPCHPGSIGALRSARPAQSDQPNQTSPANQLGRPARPDQAGRPAQPAAQAAARNDTSGIAGNALAPIVLAVDTG